MAMVQKLVMWQILDSAFFGLAYIRRGRASSVPDTSNASPHTPSDVDHRSHRPLAGAARFSGARHAVAATALSHARVLEKFVASPLRSWSDAHAR